MTHNVLYDGATAAPPEQVPLRAGPLTLVWQAGDLRSVHSASWVELLQRVYVAVRDRNWNTIPGQIRDVRMAIQPDAFQIDFSVDHRQGEVDFTWDGSVTGAKTGLLTYRMRGVARTGFWKNRIGLCLLLPAVNEERLFLVEGADGVLRDVILPRKISPEQPVPGFGDLRALARDGGQGLWAEMRLEGDVFEMEDQRNWTDASFKVFSTPLRLPYPAWIEAGTVVEQSLTLRLLRGAELLANPRERPAANDAAASADAPALAGVQTTTGAGVPQPIHVSTGWGGKDGMPYPKLGLGLARHGQPLTARELTLLRELRLNHLRVDLRLEDVDYSAALRQAVEQAEVLDTRLHVGLIGADLASVAWDRLRALVEELRPPVDYWLVYPAVEEFGGGSPTAAAVQAARAALEGAVADAKFAAGTNADLIFLQRTPPPVDQIDAVCFSINPQVHAFDNQSIVDTIAAQGTAVETARELSGGLPVLVSPVTLKPRHNPYASAEGASDSDSLPPDVDPRQMSLLGAGWTLASLRELVAAKAECVTMFETTGWRGVINTADAVQDDRFPALPGAAFPIYHLLRWISRYTWGELMNSYASPPGSVAVLGMRDRDTGRLILANLTGQSQRVEVSGVGCDLFASSIGPGPDDQLQCGVKLHRLDETNALAAMTVPDTFQALPAEAVPAPERTLQLELLPYALAAVQWVNDEDELDQPPPISLTTARLVVRELRYDDLPRMAQMNAEPGYLRYERDEARTESQLEHWMHHLDFEKNSGMRRSFPMAITLPENDSFLGSVSLTLTNTETREWEIGWGVMTEYWGRGYASEAAAALLEFARTKLNAHRVVAFCHADNAASARVMEKIGMTREARTRQTRWLGGQWWDELLYAVILNS